MASPIRPSVEDQVSDGTKRQVLKHNELGVELCGWNK